MLLVFLSEVCFHCYSNTHNSLFVFIAAWFSVYASWSNNCDRNGDIEFYDSDIDPAMPNTSTAEELNVSKFFYSYPESARALIEEKKRETEES